MASDLAHITIGLRAAQVLAVKVRESALKDLRKALEGDVAGFYDLETETGVVALSLGDVVYVQTTSNEHRVGFGL
jgi:hypothetical protein